MTLRDDVSKKWHAAHRDHAGYLREDEVCDTCKDPPATTAMVLGETWYSYDNGHSFTRQQVAQTPSEYALQVVKVDRARGEVTLTMKGGGKWLT
jgi:hypothetical protein